MGEKRSSMVVLKCLSPVQLVRAVNTKIEEVAAMQQRRERVRYGILVVLLVVAACCWAATASARTAAVAPAAKEKTLQEGVGAKAEWLPVRRVLMHTPGDELFAGVIHPEAALFERPFDIAKASAEHRAFIDQLRKNGAQVYTVVETLLEGTIDAHGNPVAGEKLDDLRAFASMFLAYDTANLAIEDQAKQEAYKRFVLDHLHPAELVKTILQQPTVHLLATESNTGYAGMYEFSPVMNLYFCRDQMITTAKGVVLGRMNSQQRGVETEIMKFVLKKLGVTPVYQVQGDGRLEGGDYFSVGNTAFIGQGLRTNEEGVRQLLENKVFGLPRVAVVKDLWKNMEQMHLDTYFNIAGAKLGVLVKERYDGADPTKRSQVDLYELVDGVYKLKKQDIEFRSFLEKDMGFTLIPVSREDQNNYAINFLAVGPNRILAVDGASAAYKKALKDQGVNAVWLDMKNLTGGYGAAHCTTQPFFRDER